jgi:hypothetical protein
MRSTSDLPTSVDIVVTTRGELPGVDGYVREKIGGLLGRMHQPVRHARVRVSKHADRAVVCPVVAQANLDVDGRLVRAQVQAATAREAVDALEARVRRRLEHLGRYWDSQGERVRPTDPHEWRHNSIPARKAGYFPRPLDERRVIRRKTFTCGPVSVDDTAQDMELLDYDFHLFTERGTNQASVLYRTGTGFRLAQVKPTSREELASFALPLTISPQPAPRLTLWRAIERLGFLGLPFLFFIEMAEGRAFVLYRRYDGHYGLISPAG